MIFLTEQFNNCLLCTKTDALVIPFIGNSLLTTFSRRQRQGAVDQMKKLSTYLRLIAAAAVANILLAGVASAGPISGLLLTGTTFNPPIKVNVTGIGGRIVAGEYTGSFNGDAFLSYCVDLAQSVRFGTLYAPSNYSLVSPESVLNPVKLGNLEKLFNTRYSDSQVNAANSGAFQLAIWEIISESGPSFSLSNGSFQASYLSDTSALGSANLWLSELSGYSAGNIELRVYHSATNQDLISIVPRTSVPEPATMSLALVAFGVMGLTKRRRRRAGKSSL